MNSKMNVLPKVSGAHELTGEKTRLWDVIGMKEKARYIKYLVCELP
jgi:hypothetical protein